MSEKKNSAVGGIVGIIVAIGAAWFFFGGGLEKQTANEIQKISNQVAEDAVKQYEIAKRNGNAMDALTQAGIVAEAYLQAKDEVNYQKWVKIRKAEAARAGMPKELQ
jgi:hypothetical protein